jgi:hypothetical protein
MFSVQSQSQHKYNSILNYLGAKLNSLKANYKVSTYSKPRGHNNDDDNNNNNNNNNNNIIF